MSDTAIFITISADELNNNGQLPGDLRSLRNLLQQGERSVHVEVVADAPLPEKTLNVLHMAGAIIHILPSSTDTSASLVGGLMSRLHEFICAYPHVAQFIVAGADVDRLDSVGLFLQRAGFYVILAGPDRSRLDAVRNSCDDVAIWSSGRQSRDSGRDSSRDSSRDSGRDSGGRDSKSKDSGSKLDPYEVLVEEVTKVRNKGNRVLLTSLKQRIRKKIRRFDETRLKDVDGKPMKQFKDFVLDAVNRDLIQLVEKGNASHVLLPGEDIPEDGPDDENEDTGDNENTSKDSGGVDPLLDNVDMAEETETEAKDLPNLKAKDFDVQKVNEEAPAPPENFLVFIDNLIPKEGLALDELLHQLHNAQKEGHLELTNRELKKQLQNAFFNELLEPVNDGDPVQYVVVDDWKDIIDFL